MGTLGATCAEAKTMGNCVTFRAFDTAVAVFSDSETLEKLDRFLLPTLPRVHPGSHGADITLRIRSHNDSGYELSCDGSTKRLHDFRALAVEAVRLVDEGIVARLSNRSAVHAGVVAFGERTLLLPGKSHSGKSSLVAELLRRGATYLSDEYALIDDRGFVHAYPRPLMLRLDSGDQVPSVAGEFGAPVATAPGAAAWIFALEYDRKASWKIEPIPASEALMVLLKNTPHELARTPRLLSALTRASSGAVAFAGRRGDAVVAAEHVLRIVGS